MNDDQIGRLELNQLAEIHDQRCVSLLVPTERNQKGDKGRLRLKNLLRKTKDELKVHGLNEMEIEDLLAPAGDLLEEAEFWRNQADCLAIFLTTNSSRLYRLPIRCDEVNYIADHFYLVPLLDLLSSQKTFYLLSLSLNKIELFYCSDAHISPVDLRGLVPRKMDDVFGTNEKEKSLQFRTGQGGEAGILYHGQGAGKDMREHYLKKFLRAVDKGILKLMDNREIPLILAGVEHYYPIYKQITDYPHLFPEMITGNHEHTADKELLSRARQLLNDHADERTLQTPGKAKPLPHSGRISMEINEIVPAAIDGRIETLYLKKGVDRYGHYDRVNRTLIIAGREAPGEASLFNLAAVETWLKGGAVHLMSPEDMPFSGSTINALLRY